MYREYDSLVAGTSMCMNFSLADVRTCLKWKAPLKITAPGCHSATFRLFVDRAYRYRALRHVLCSVDLLWLDNPPGSHHVALEPFLYDRSFVSECSYLLNGDVVFGAAGETVLANFRRDARLNPDLMFGLRDVAHRVSCGGSRVMQELMALKTTAGGSEETRDENNKSAVDRMLGNVRRDIIPLVREHPETEFLFFFPPYVNIKWAECLAAGTLPTLLAAKEAIAEELCACPNVAVFDFQAEVALVTDPNQYKDAVHYSPEVSRRLLEDMGTGRFKCCAADVRRSSDLIAELARKALRQYRPDLVSAASRCSADAAHIMSARREAQGRDRAASGL